MTHNRINATDTLKNLANNPREALDRDYQQTKADMANIKEGIKDTVGQTVRERMTEEEREKYNEPDI